MSTAVMSASALYEFGDLLYKSNNNNSGSGGLQKPAAARWNSVSTPSSSDSRAVGSPVVGNGLVGLQPLSRRNSNPVGISSNSFFLSSIGNGNKFSQNSLLSFTSESVNSEFGANSSSSNNNIGSVNVNQSTQHSQHRRLDRSQSEPVERANVAMAAAAAAVAAAAAAAAAKSNINTSRYKTELCRPFEESGSCKYGDKCQFAHGAQELRTLVRHPKYKTELCRTFHSSGFCPYGPRCHFIHNAEEARAAAAANAAANGSGSNGVSKSGQVLSLSGSNGPLSPQQGGSAAPQHHHHFYHHTRPKPLSSLGSTAESPSPPSSLSESPTSLSSFFSEPDLYPGNAFSSPPSSSSSSSSANTAFSFGQDFTSLVRPGSLGRMVRKTEPASPPPLNLPSLAPSGGVLGRRNLSLGDLDGVREALVMPLAMRENPHLESPVGSLEALCLNDSPLDSPTSPDSPKEIGRLPVFNRLSRKVMGVDI
ncbi:hypothetical protein J437_LFUL010075 [Ladona fulva]|uniref:C3H1-type domain-containing protein n=1 Tax=Ladona fulva TaxID=123851 RepID=A0A8K0KBG3_LADFU|nr:hypothetical protein J437_LFUL010075 [Ladona fulva]